MHDGRLFGYVGDLSKLAEIEIGERDVLLVPGAWWAYPESLLNVMKTVSARGGSNVVMQHDMIPFLHWDLCNHDARKIVDWFERIVLRGDAVMCATKSVAHEFIDFVASRKLPFKQNLRLGWQAHGCDFPVPDHDAPMSARVGAVCKDQRPFFLSVSTLEPRKGYSVALDAIERLWREGVDIRYVIVGRHGWNANALARRILSHAEFGRRLFWLKDASDAELRDLYEHARRSDFSVRRGRVWPGADRGRALRPPDHRQRHSSVSRNRRPCDQLFRCRGQRYAERTGARMSRGGKNAAFDPVHDLAGIDGRLARSHRDGLVSVRRITRIDRGARIA